MLGIRLDRVACKVAGVSTSDGKVAGMLTFDRKVAEMLNFDWRVAGVLTFDGKVDGMSTFDGMLTFGGGGRLEGAVGVVEMLRSGGDKLLLDIYIYI